MKRILYLSFYFEPDLSAGSFRNTPLAKELAVQAGKDTIIEVITTAPNRYSTFTADAPEHEQVGNFSVRRITLPLHKNGFGDQINSFRYFLTKVNKIVKDKKYDLVYASSSRLFTAYLGYRIAKRQKIPLYLDIRDIFRDTMNDVLKNKAFKAILLPVLNIVEKKIFSYATHINLISEGFHPYFKKYERPRYSFFTNGIDDDFILDEKAQGYDISPAKPLIITYAGNIGEGQGLHKIIPQAAAAGDVYFFRVIGDGGAKQLLVNEIERLGVKNVRIENPVSRKDLINIYKQSHFLLIHLNDYNAFEKVLPSKVFEAGAFPRPILAGVSGYARKFISENIENVILFKPGNEKELMTQLAEYSYHYGQRTSFIERYKRSSINKRMAASILQYV